MKKRLLRSIVYGTLGVRDAKRILASEIEQSRIRGEYDDPSEEEEEMKVRIQDDNLDNNEENVDTSTNR